MYKLIHAHHALNDDTTIADDMYVGECQDASKFNKDLVQGNILMCSYTMRFVLGLSSINKALETAMNLSAAGVVFPMNPSVNGFELDPIPMKIPGIIIPFANDSKVICPFSPSSMYMCIVPFFIGFYFSIQYTYIIVGFLIINILFSTGQILLEYYNSSIEKDGTSEKIVKLGAFASINGGLTASYSNVAPSVMYYSARGPDPEDSLPHEADILKPNLVAPGSLIWAAWSSVATDSDEFLGLLIHRQTFTIKQTEVLAKQSIIG
jgi:hypothetical protein